MNITFDQLIECIGNAEMSVEVFVPTGRYCMESDEWISERKCISIIDPQSLIEALKDMQNNSGWRGGPR